MIRKKRNIILIAVGAVLSAIAAVLYFTVGKKIREAGKKLEVAGVYLSPAKRLDIIGNLVEAFTSGLVLKGRIEIRNFSTTQDYKINQLKIDILNPVSGDTIARKTNIQTEDIKFEKASTANVNVEYECSVGNAMRLFKDCEVWPEELTVWQVLMKPAKYLEIIKLSNLKVKLLGFIEVEGFTVNIEETIEVL